MAKNVKKEIIKQKEMSYSNKDFNSLRQMLKNYAATHFSDRIIDFTDASVGGLLLDLGASIGDTLMYYMDHQFNENSLENAIERRNIERLVREAGVRIPYAAPAYAEIDISIVVPAVLSSGEYIPVSNGLPTIRKNSIFTTRNNIDFQLLDDVNFSERNSDSKLLAKQTIGRTLNGNPVNFILSRKGLVSSAKIGTETVTIADKFIPFRSIVLGSSGINEIISVIDSAGDIYHEVDSLSQDTVFKPIENSRYDNEDVPYRLEMLHAPKRYIVEKSVNTGKTTIRFGSGRENSFDEDTVPDPSEHAISLYGDRVSFPSIAIDPNSFLETQTLGISPQNTSLTITYTYGGGLSHNVSAGEISSVKTLLADFQESTPASTETYVRSSLSVNNLKSAAGGEDAPTLEELRNIALFNRSSQNRIVTREDLLARIYSMPTNFGRVFRAAVSDNPRNPRGSQLHIISRNSSGNLSISPDTLKQNLSKYLNKFRLVSDSIDILDAIIVNFGIKYYVTIEKGYRSEIVINAINSKLSNYFEIKNYQINKPLVLGEIENIVLNSKGVVSIISLEIFPLSNTNNGLNYSSYSLDVNSHLDRGYIFPPLGGIFEMKYPNENIVGRVV